MDVGDLWFFSELMVVCGGSGVRLVFGVFVMLVSSFFRVLSLEVPLIAVKEIAPSSRTVTFHLGNVRSSIQKVISVTAYQNETRALLLYCPFVEGQFIRKRLGRLLHSRFDFRFTSTLPPVLPNSTTTTQKC